MYVILNKFLCEDYKFESLTTDVSLDSFYKILGTLIFTCKPVLSEEFEGIPRIDDINEWNKIGNFDSVNIVAHSDPLVGFEYEIEVKATLGSLTNDFEPNAIQGLATKVPDDMFKNADEFICWSMLMENN